MNFTNKRVLVTGAETNTGFGIAQRFAEAGARVALHGLSAAATRKAAARLTQENGREVLPLVADFRKPKVVDRMFVEIQREFGGLDILVNNAVDQAIGYSFVDTTPEFLAGIIQVNLVAPFRCAQLAVKMMMAGQGGAVVNIGSNTADRAIRDRSAYVTTKGAIGALTRAMAVELGAIGIRVNTVVPGYIFTQRWERLPTASAKRRRANVPLGREATARDIADAVLFLASEDARCITGTTLLVDSGSGAQLVPRDVEK